MFRALIPPLTIVLSLVTALACFVAAVAIAPPPVPDGARAAPHLTATPIPAAYPVVTSLVRGEHVVIPPAPVAIGLVRLTFMPGANGPRWALPGPLLLAVESGDLAAWFTSGLLLRADGTSESVGGDILLHPGDGLLLPASTRSAFRSAGTAPALVLAAGVFPASGAVNGEANAAPTVNTVWSPAAEVSPLAGGTAGDIATSSVWIELTRVTLPPGATIPLTTRGAQTLTVEFGALTLTADQGLITLPDAEDLDVWLSSGATATLLPGDGALLQDMAGSTLQNDGSGPLQILVLAVTADDEV